MKKIILASGSPRRQELLSQIGISFEVRTSDADESLQDQSPSEAVEELSFRKASDVASKPEYSDTWCRYCRCITGWHDSGKTFVRRRCLCDAKRTSGKYPQRIYRRYDHKH